MKLRIAACVLVSVLLFSVAPRARGQMTPQQAIAKMTRGINLGRSLEQPGYEGRIQEYYLDDIKNVGFNFVRVPVKWDEHTGTNAPYTVDSAWLDRVQQVVDWGLERGLIVMINSHHDYWILENSSYTASDKARFEAIWTQAAERLKTNSANLFFEIANEPNQLSISQINQLNASVISIIRSNNPTRIIVYSGNGYTSVDQMKAAARPNDPYIMATFHSYDPWDFAGLGNGTWGTDADKQAVTNRLNSAASWSQQYNIPVILGEWGTVGNINRTSRELYFAAYMQQASRTGVAPCVWHDFGDFGIYYPNNSAATRWSYVKDIIMANSRPGVTTNAAPTLDVLENLTINENAGLQTVNLTGISSGVSNEVQTLTVAAVSSNVSLIPTPAVTYISPNTTGTLTFTPVAHASGAATITVTVNDGGVSNNIVTRAFTVTVAAAPNLPFEITGITTGSNTVGLTWTSNTGRLYAVEYSLNLLTWSNLVTGIPAAIGTNKTSIILDLTGSSTGTDAVLVQYQMGQFGPQIQDGTNAAAGGNLTNGSGLNTFNPNSTQAYPTTPSLAITFSVASTNLSAALANQAWFTLTLTVGSSVADLDLTSLTFNAARGGAGTPRGYGVFVTTPTTTNEQVQGATDLTTQRTDWGPLQSVNLSGFASLQHLSAGQTVTFKIAAYAPTTSSSLDFDNITVNGKVSAGHIPPYTGSEHLFFRVRQ